MKIRCLAVLIIFSGLFVGATVHNWIDPEVIVIQHMDKLVWGVYRGEDREAITERLLLLADDSGQGVAARLVLAKELNNTSGYLGSEDTFPKFTEAILRHSLRWLGVLQVVEAEPLLTRYREFQVPKDIAPEKMQSILSLKYWAAMSYWQVKAMTYSNTEEQNAFLLRLVEEKVQSSITPGTREWAAEELADRGVIGALPVITASFERHSNFDLALSEQLWRIKRKMELISTSTSRVAALKAALEEENEKDWYSLKYWAVEELAKLNTEESCEILLDYLRSAQSRCFDAADESGRIADFRKDLSDGERRECMELGGHYTHIVSIMEFIGFDDQRLNEAGVFPGVYFFAL